MLYGISFVTVYIRLTKKVRSPVSIMAWNCEDVFVIPSATNMQFTGSFIHYTRVFP